MRTLWIAAAVLVTCVVTVFVVHGRWVHPHLLASTGPIALRDSSGQTGQLPPETATAIRDWVSSHQSGWRVSFTTYAPHTTVSCDTFHMNFGGNLLVLNYARHAGDTFVQLVRDLPPEEQAFWRKTLAAAKEP